MDNLTRFRANPNVLKVSIRKTDNGWSARIMRRDESGIYYGYHSTDPRRAVLKVLHIAHRMGMAGIDLQMQWAYIHPQKASNG